jgi:hypothetical protein
MSAAPSAGRAADRTNAMVHVIHLPQAHARDTQGDFAGLHLALRAAGQIPGKHLILAINSASRLDRMMQQATPGRIEFGCICPTDGNIGAVRAHLFRVLERWMPGAVVIWHPGLSMLGTMIERRGKRVDVIRAWQAPTQLPGALERSRTLAASESHAMSIPVSAMSRLLAREQMGLLADDERPLVTLLSNVPTLADAWWFSVVMSLMEAAGISAIGTIPALSRQRGRARRYRHVSGLATPVIEYDSPLSQVLEASDVVISVGRDTDSDMECGTSIDQPVDPALLNRVIICRALACAIPTIVPPTHAELIPSGLRGSLVADGTRASQIAARLFTLLGTSSGLEQTRRVLVGSLIPVPDADIIAWVRDRLSLRDLHAHRTLIAESVS